MLDDVLYIEETTVTVRKYRHRTTVPAKIFKIVEAQRWRFLKVDRDERWKNPHRKKSTK